MAILIPIWFYSVDSIIYAFAAFISLLVTYYAFKLSSLTGKRNHKFLYYGFLFLSVGFFILTIVNSLSYANLLQCPSCTLSFVDQIVGIDEIGYMIYFLLSITAYFCFIAMHQLDGKNFFALVLLPVSSIFQPFNLVGLLLVSFIAVRSVINYFSDKNRFSKLIMFGFVFIMLYHLLLFLNPLGGLTYTLGHLSLLAGLISFLAMVIQVRKK